MIHHDIAGELFVFNKPLSLDAALNFEVTGDHNLLLKELVPLFENQCLHYQSISTCLGFPLILINLKLGDFAYEGIEKYDLEVSCFGLSFRSFKSFQKV